MSPLLESASRLAVAEELLDPESLGADEPEQGAFEQALVSPVAELLVALLVALLEEQLVSLVAASALLVALPEELLVLGAEPVQLVGLLVQVPDEKPPAVEPPVVRLAVQLDVVEQQLEQLRDELRPPVVEPLAEQPDVPVRPAEHVAELPVELAESAVAPLVVRVVALLAEPAVAPLVVRVVERRRHLEPGWLVRRLVKWPS